MNKDHIKYLAENKASIIKKKRAMPLKFAMPIGYEGEDVVKVAKAKALTIKEGELMSKGNYVDVKVIANLSGWMDYDDDVILRGAYTRTIKGKDPASFPFMKDHNYKMDSIIGDTLAVTTQEMRMRELGYDSDKSGEALIFEARVWEDYDKAMYAKYLNGAVKQHSISLRYVKVDLAVNDPSFEDEYKIWEKYNDQVINFDKAIKNGYFWAVQEIKLLENSAVVFGSNSMTPTISAQQGEKSEPATVGTSASKEDKTDSPIRHSDGLEFFKYL